LRYILFFVFSGIEDLMDEMDLEENVAVVVMGGNARVMQHLTNDLTLVREAIGQLCFFAFFLYPGFARSLELSGIVGNFQMSFPDVL
jgi:hypothetical protein